MNISKALKVKNRLIGELAKQQEIARRENSRRSDNPSSVDVEKIFSTIQQTRLSLVTLKQAIVKASAAIAYELADLAEVKQYINWISGIQVREGEEKVAYGQTKEAEVYKWTAHINRATLDTLLEQYQKQANNLQDIIDDFNAKTQVDWLG